MNNQLPIGIIGGGLAGLTLACLLGRAGKHVLCLDAQSLERQLSSDFDGRTTAISYASSKVLDAAGVWAGMLAKAQPIERIDILDGDSPDVLVFDVGEMDVEAFGWIVDNADLRRSLIKQVQSLDTVTHLTGAFVDDVEFHEDYTCIKLKDGSEHKVTVAIGADGRKSILRDKMGIGTYGRDYNQAAVVCLVTHELPHNNLAVEHFLADGPFAMLPFTNTDAGENRSAVVWSVKTKDAKDWVEAPEDIFNAALNVRSQGRYGEIKLAGRREFWPLNLVKAYSYVGVRSVLVAEAAHGIHPIAGQGLNMSLRDLATLSDIMIQASDAGAPQTLRTFQRRRRLDNISMMLATDILTMLFSNDITPIRMARRAGLRVVSRLGPIKRFFMGQAMGLGVHKNLDVREFSELGGAALSKVPDIYGKLRQYLPKRRQTGS